MLGRFWLLVALLALSGCASPPATPDGPEPEPTATAAPTSSPAPEPTATAAPTSSPAPEPQPKRPPGVVVADVSAGANVYHEAFRRPGWTHHPSQVVPGFPADAPALWLTFGDDYAANVAADAAVWEAFEVDTLYWIPGTNLLLWALDPWETLPLGHGHSLHSAATAGAINAACPGCYVLVVVDRNNWDGGALDALAMEPWVDFVQSTQFSGGAALPGGSERHAASSRTLYDNGSLYFVASGNQVVNGLIGPLLLSDWNWPPWVVNVGGGHEACSAGEATSGQYPEFVADFYQVLPGDQSVSDNVPVVGTSFASPQAAGRFGQALWLVRQELGYGDGGRWSGTAHAGYGLEDGVLTAQELRAAFGQAAEYFDAIAFHDPAQCAYSNAPVPIGPAAYVQQGWGHLTQAVPDIVAQAILGHAPLPAKDAAAEAWMDALMRLRAARYP